MCVLSSLSSMFLVIHFLSFTPGTFSQSVSTRVSSAAIYNDLKRMNISCGGLGSCRNRRSGDDLLSANCHCGPTCAELGTCCYDSVHRVRVGEKVNRIRCANLAWDRGVLMLGTCKPDWSGDDSVKELCGSNREEMNDPFLMQPVTNTRTGITYRNYYCLVCNDDDGDADSIIFWDMKLVSPSEKVLGPSLPDITFDKELHSWIIRGTDKLLWMKPKFPKGLKSNSFCRFFLFDSCGRNWKDEAVRNKCDAYTLLVNFGTETVWFKNPHCAMCWGEDMSKPVCAFDPGEMPDVDHPSELGGVPLVGLFAMEKGNRCPKNKVYDHWGKKCRSVKCGRSKTLRNGECVDKRSSG